MNKLEYLFTFLTSFSVIKMDEEFLHDEEEMERFSELVDTSEILSRKIERIPKNTLLANKWHVNIWNEWSELEAAYDLAKSRGCKSVTILPDGSINITID